MYYMQTEMFFPIFLLKHNLLIIAADYVLRLFGAVSSNSVKAKHFSCMKDLDGQYQNSDDR